MSQAYSWLAERRLLSLACSPLLPLLFTMTCCCLLASHVSAQEDDVNPSYKLGCYQRLYQYNVTKSAYVTPEGKILTCSGRVSVLACWGHCDTSELGNYETPYKIPNHRVCTYAGRPRWRRVMLSDCDIGYPNPTYDVFDAAACQCRFCNSDYTSCEDFGG